MKEAQAPLMASVVSGDTNDVNEGHSQTAVKRSCRDPIFAAVFLAQVGCLGYYGSTTFSKRDEDMDDAKRIINGTAVGYLVGAAVFGALLCGLWFKATLHNAKGMLVSSL
jgi:hypothetical protein